MYGSQFNKCALGGIAAFFAVAVQFVVTLSLLACAPTHACAVLGWIPLPHGCVAGVCSHVDDLPALPLEGLTPRNIFYLHHPLPEYR